MSSRHPFPAAQRRDQILDAARELFGTKGYRATTIEDLLSACDIARGTLYHHFSGKEEVLLELVRRTATEMAVRAAMAVPMEGPAMPRFLGVIESMRATGHDATIAAEMNETGNAEFHLLSVVEMVRAITPILTRIVEDGVAAGEFDCPDPVTTVEMILVSGGMLLDDGIFAGEADQAERRMSGLMANAARLLGVPTSNV